MHMFGEYGMRECFCKSIGAIFRCRVYVLGRLFLGWCGGVDDGVECNVHPSLCLFLVEFYIYIALVVYVKFCCSER